jgi:hypothetical protein
MLSELQQFFLGLGSRAFEQTQNEAILTLLTWMMVVDGKLSPAEHDKLDEFIGSIEWTSETPPRQFVAETVKRVKPITAGSPEEAKLCKELAAKLVGGEIRYKALQACHQLAKADDYFDQAEKHLLKLFSHELIF